MEFVDAKTVVRPAKWQEGVFATTNLEVNSLAFVEKPLERLQSLGNRQEVLICSHCFKYVSDMKTSIQLLTGEKNRQDAVTNSNCKVDNSCNTSKHIYCIPITCRHQCGEIYCSINCADSHWNESHHKLCTGCITDEEAKTHPLIAFKLHACQTNEIFLMAADIFAKIVVQVEEASSNGISLDKVLNKACSPYSNYVRPKWWEAVANCSDELKSTLMNLVHESWFLLDSVLQLSIKGLSPMLNADYLAETIGMFERNNVGIRLSNRTGQYISDMISTNTNNEVQEQYLKIVKQIVKRQEAMQYHDSDFMEEEDLQEELEIGELEEEDVYDDEEDEEDDKTLQGYIEQKGGIDAVFPPVNGAAFFLHVCKINHSCEPNVQLIYDEDASGMIARVEVIRPIAVDEELLHSYVDCHAPKEERDAALLEYGIICKCNKCASE